MFIIEKLLQDYRNKVDAWQKARDEWVKGGNEYGYRNNREYEDSHPRPTNWVRIVWKVLMIKVCIALAVFLMIGFIKEVNNRPHDTKKKESAKVVTYKNGDKCGNFYVGDIATIKYGDYEGAEVKIIGGCSNDEDYKVVATKDQLIHGAGSATEDETDTHIMPGAKFSVNTAKNLIMTGHVKE